MNVAPHMGEGEPSSRSEPSGMVLKLFAQWPRKWAFPVFGFVLALGAPLGLFVLRAALFGASPWFAWAASEIGNEYMTYVYELVTTSAAFGLLGYFLGRTHDKLRETALTDSLTLLANRRHFNTRLADEMKRARRYGGPLSLLFVDVDGLKGINDRYGHEGGDLAIRLVADALRDACRQTDLVARIGGDEFAVIAPETLAPDAVALGERIRVTLAEVRERTTLDHLSVSIGVAPFSREFGTPPAFCESADNALYAAKRSGRNRVRLADSERHPANDESEEHEPARAIWQ